MIIDYGKYKEYKNELFLLILQKLTRIGTIFYIICFCGRNRRNAAYESLAEGRQVSQTIRAVMSILSILRLVIIPPH